MNVQQLLHWVEQPETHRKIIGDYEGSYSLGVVDDPPALLLRVEPADVSAFPIAVTLHGEEVPVRVQGGFAPPKPLGGHR